MQMWTDRRTDVGHMNLIGGLVTCNPPKNLRCSHQQVIAILFVLQATTRTTEEDMVKMFDSFT